VPPLGRDRRAYSDQAAKAQAVGRLVIDVTLPKWGVTMQEATLTNWLVDEGAPVAAGEPLAHFETDKVDVVLEAPAAGIVARRCVLEGEIVKVGGLVAMIDES
jgi:pyruvate/2-oxoglutarate dehydrogenase complex dihydrolipoamide acyltransferase (E2) component